MNNGALTNKTNRMNSQAMLVALLGSRAILSHLSAGCAKNNLGSNRGPNKLQVKP